jgi:energy-coupling factor transport system substrate-specific component
MKRKRYAGEPTTSRYNSQRRMFWVTGVIGVLVLVVLLVSTSMGWPWYLTVIAMAALLLFLVATLYERAAIHPKQIALVATLAAVSSVSRAAVQAIPNAQPATFFVLLSGFSLGPTTGAAVGVFTAIGSNLFLGEGGWTPWQMLGWGLVGWSAGMLRRALGSRTPTNKTIWFLLAPVGFAWGFLFDWLMDTWTLLAGGTAGITSFLVVVASGLPFDVNHAVATLLLTLIAGPIVFRILERYRRRLQITRLSPEALDTSSAPQK